MGDILTREEVAQLLKCAAEAFPLQWPDGWPRTRARGQARYRVSFAVARDDLVRELGLCEACYLSHQPCTADQSEDIMAFRALWDEINAKRGCGWERNRHVLVYEWERHHG